VSSLSPESVDLVQQSFRRVQPQAAAVAAAFYTRLFELDPSLRPLFPENLEGQGAKLTAALAFVVQGLKRPEALLGKVEELASRHVGYGVEPRHYETVGAALLDTLQAGLGDDFTPALRDAWTEAYGFLSGTMIALAYGETAANRPWAEAAG